jgi:hypothetical protein
MEALAALALLLGGTGMAPMYEQPRSFSLKEAPLEAVQRKVLPVLDVENLQEQDQQRRKDPRHPSPLRFAIGVDVAFSLENSGTTRTLPEGRVWRLRIHSPGAASLNLGITRFDVPAGVKLWVYDPAGKQVEGPYAARHRSRQGRLWTPVIQGDEIVVEVFTPTGISQPRVEIGKVNLGYRGFVDNDVR